jgi:hypothetical protein
MNKPTFVGILLLFFLFTNNFENNNYARATQIKDILAITIQGRVISIYGPVENARVRIAGDDKYTLTDRQGPQARKAGLIMHKLPVHRVSCRIFI